MAKSIKINAVLNAVRQSLSVIFPLITFPYVSRILGSSEYGRYTFSSSIISYMSLLASFGISNYAIREGARFRNDKSRLNTLASDLFTINIVTTIVAYIVIYILINCNKKLYDYKFLIAVQSLSIILTTIGMDWVNTIYEDFLYITIRYAIIQVLALIAVFAFVKDQNDTAIYCAILVLGSYGGNLINLIYIRKYIHITINFKLKIQQYIKPLSILFVNSLATVIYVNSDITMLGLFYGNREVGLYSFAAKIYNVIKYFINSIMIVIVPRLAYIKEHDERKYISFIQKTINILTIFLFPIAAGVFGLSKSLIIIAGGNEYLPSNMSLKILAISLIFALVSSVFSNCILIINRLEKRCLISTTISASINVLLNIILIPRIGIVGAAITTVAAEMINMFIQAYYIRKELNIFIQIAPQNKIRIILNSTFVLVVSFIVNHVLTATNLLNACLRMSITFVISLLGCVGILVVTDNNILKNPTDFQK